MLRIIKLPIDYYFINRKNINLLIFLLINLLNKNILSIECNVLAQGDVFSLYVSNTNPCPGQEIIFTIISNPGIPVTNVLVTDKLDLGLEFVSADSGGVYDPNTRIITWKFDSLPSTQIVLKFVAIIAENFTGETIENQAFGGSDQTPAQFRPCSSNKIVLNIKSCIVNALIKKYCSIQ